MLREFIELGQLRLDRGWTYRELAAEVNKISPRTITHARLFTLLNDPKQHPNDLTLHGVRAFLASLRSRREKVSA